MSEEAGVQGATCPAAAGGVLVKRSVTEHYYER